MQNRRLWGRGFFEFFNTQLFEYFPLILAFIKRIVTLFGDITKQSLCD